MMEPLNPLHQVRFDEKGATIHNRILTIENPETPTSRILMIDQAESPKPVTRFLNGRCP